MNTDVATSSRVVILAAIDETSASEDVLRTAAVLAQTLAGSEVHLLHVVRPVTNVDGAGAPITTLTESVESVRSVVDRGASRAAESFSGRIVRHLAFGTPWREILQLATDLHSDLIVVGSHRRNRVERWILGSDSEQVVRKASCAVLVARPKDYQAESPEIEPPCPDCVATQKQTHGERLWCSGHDRSKKHPHARLHYDVPQPFAVGSQLIRAEG
jgi:nucleotide-binding universal stress UspA family protein